MSEASGSQSDSTPSLPRRFVSRFGDAFVNTASYIGGNFYLICDASVWIWRSAITRQVRFGRRALYSQIVRVGVRSIGVISLVSACVGLILALQMAPPLREFGQVNTVANIIAIAVVRELGPLIGAIVLTGFAGASIAAELGTMVVGEEIEALEAHALNPIRFLVMPRLVATTLSMSVLTIIAEIVAIGAGMAMGVLVLEIPAQVYYDNTIEQLKLADFLTGLWKGSVFGLLVGLIACYNGLSVSGGAAGVGQATTRTVVFSIIAIILTDLLFTAAFYAMGWN